MCEEGAALPPCYSSTKTTSCTHDITATPACCYDYCPTVTLYGLVINTLGSLHIWAFQSRLLRDDPGWHHFCPADMQSLNTWVPVNQHTDCQVIIPILWIVGDLHVPQMRISRVWKLHHVLLNISLWRSFKRVLKLLANKVYIFSLGVNAVWRFLFYAHIWIELCEIWPFFKKLQIWQTVTWNILQTGVYHLLSTYFAMGRLWTAKTMAIAK